MNLLLLDAAEVDDRGYARLTDRRAEHLRRVLKVTPGQVLRGGLVRGPRAAIEVCAVREDGAVDVRVADQEPSPPPPRLDLIVALPRPQVLHRVLQFAAAMGARRLDLIAAWRVEKSFFASPSVKSESLARHVRLGAEQGATTWVPEVTVHHRFLPFLDTLGDRPTARLVAHPGAPLLESVWSTILGKDPVDTDPSLLVAIGPEGGWIDREIASFRDAGFVPASLGPWVLRVEAALVAVLAQVDLLRRRRPTASRSPS
jgi:RsmE family RNA methyltransferase